MFVTSTLLASPIIAPFFTEVGSEDIESTKDGRDEIKQKTKEMSQWS